VTCVAISCESPGIGLGLTTFGAIRLAHTDRAARKEWAKRASLRQKIGISKSYRNSSGFREKAAFAQRFPCAVAIPAYRS